MAGPAIKPPDDRRANSAPPAATTRTACTNSANGRCRTGSWYRAQNDQLCAGSPQPGLGTVLTQNGGSGSRRQAAQVAERDLSAGGALCRIAVWVRAAPGV